MRGCGWVDALSAGRQQCPSCRRSVDLPRISTPQLSTGLSTTGCGSFELGALGAGTRAGALVLACEPAQRGRVALRQSHLLFSGTGRRAEWKPMSILSALGVAIVAWFVIRHERQRELAAQRELRALAGEAFKATDAARDAWDQAVWEMRSAGILLVRAETNTELAERAHVQEEKGRRALDEAQRAQGAAREALARLAPSWGEGAALTPPARR
jgi:hypothetical protein